MRGPNFILAVVLAAAMAACGAGVEEGSDLAGVEGPGAEQDLKRVNCKSDRGLDSPAQVAVRVESALRIHLSASGGRDGSGAVRPVSYILTDDTGATVLQYPPSGVVYIGSSIAELNVEGPPLSPGRRYRVSLQSSDVCNNMGLSAPVDFTMPPVTPEAVPPSLTNPYIQMYWAGGSFPTVEVKVSDDTGIASLEFFANDQPVYHSDSNVWTGTSLTRAVYWAYPSNPYAPARVVTVKVVATDGAGNKTTVIQNLSLSGYLG